MAKSSRAFAALLLAIGTPISGHSAAFAMQTETPESRAQSYVSEARSTIIETSTKLGDRSITCDSEAAFEGSMKIARVDGLMQGLVNIQHRFPPYMQRGVTRAISTLGLEAGRLRLEMADGFLAANCIPQAARLYRFVLANFSSPAFEGLRQRAQLGIEDVRSRQPSDTFTSDAPASAATPHQ